MKEINVMRINQNINSKIKVESLPFPIEIYKKFDSNQDHQSHVAHRINN